MYIRIYVYTHTSVYMYMYMYINKYIYICHHTATVYLYNVKFPIRGPAFGT